MKHIVVIIFLQLPFLACGMNQKESDSERRLRELSDSLDFLFQGTQPLRKVAIGVQTVEAQEQADQDKLELSRGFFAKVLEVQRLTRKNNELTVEVKDLCDTVGEQKEEAQLLREKNRSLREALEKIKKDPECPCAIL